MSNQGNQEWFYLWQDQTETYLHIRCRLCGEEQTYNYDSDDEWHMYSLVEFMEQHRHPGMVSATVKQEALPLGGE